MRRTTRSSLFESRGSFQSHWSRRNNIRLAGQLTGYEIDVYREGMEEDVELTEFSDEIEGWVIEEFKKVGLDTAKVF